MIWEWKKIQQERTEQTTMQATTYLPLLVPGQLEKTIKAIFLQMMSILACHIYHDPWGCPFEL